MVFFVGESFIKTVCCRIRTNRMVPVFNKLPDNALYDYFLLVYICPYIFMSCVRKVRISRW